VFIKETQNKGIYRPVR